MAANSIVNAVSGRDRRLVDCAYLMASARTFTALPLLPSAVIPAIVSKNLELADIAEDHADAATQEALRYRTTAYEGTKMVQRGIYFMEKKI